MREHITTFQEGKEVLPEFVGAKVAFTRYETVAEALGAKNSEGEPIYESELALCNAAESLRMIKAREEARGVLGRRPEAGKENEYVKPTLEEAARAGNDVTVNVRGTSERKPKTAKAKVQAAAKSSGNKLFERMLADEKYRARTFRELDNEAEFNEWLAAREEVNAGAAK